MAIFCITQRVLDLMAISKDWLPDHTTNCFYISVTNFLGCFK
jgi:hypothetical protein